MKIRLAHNPLASTVELDQGELRALRLRVEIEDLEDRLLSAWALLAQGAPVDASKLRSECDCSFMAPPKSLERAERLDRIAAQHAAELMGEHFGDCVCAPCSCAKCRAESLAGVDTLGKVGKHELRMIEGVFGGPSPALTAQEAAARLDEPLSASEDWHGAHLERWNAQRRQAARYMREHAKRVAAQESDDDESPMGDRDF